MIDDSSQAEDSGEHAGGEPPEIDSTPPAHEADDPLAALAAEKDTLNDRLLRLAAEFDNYRKRIDRERGELGHVLAAEILSELLPIVDDLERALAAPSDEHAAAYRQGVELIHKQLMDLLRRRGARAIDAVGADFDPELHQAIARESSDAHREGEIIEEFRRGYMIGDRLLRASMVKVATP